MTEDPRVIREGVEFEEYIRYNIRDVLTSEALKIVRESDNPRDTLCSLVGITGDFPGESCGWWVEGGVPENVIFLDYSDDGGISFIEKLEPTLYLKWKNDTVWY